MRTINNNIENISLCKDLLNILIQRLFININIWKINILILLLISIFVNKKDIKRETIKEICKEIWIDKYFSQ